MMKQQQTWEELDRLIRAQMRESDRLTALAPVAEKKLRLAVKRMAGPPIKRLAWVVDFARRDLADLHPGEKEALGYDLRGLVVHSLEGLPGYRMKQSALSDDALRDYQKTIAQGIRGLLSDPPQEWPFRAEPRVVVVEANSAGARKSNRRRFAVRLGGDETASVLGGVANLIAEAGEHLRACLECGAPFVAAMKQARYHSSSCSQRARNKRR